MDFSERLNSYLQELGVSAKELSEESGVSQVVISRYRSGQRIPTPENMHSLRDLAIGIESLSRKKKIRLISASEVLEAFDSDLSEVNVSFCDENFNRIMEVFGLNASEMAHSMSYDPSYISRLRTGKRVPPNPEEFLQKLSDYIFSRLGKSIPALEFYDLLGVTPPEKTDPDTLKKQLRAYILKNANNEKAVNSFLKSMDEFNLDDYIKKIHFDDLRVPTLPFTFPKEKTYFGVKGQKAAELDIFKLIVLSKSTEPVFLYSDMEMEELAEDKNFQKKWLFGLAMMLKKGLRLRYVHNLNRPMNEMMIALENLIPMYMTGQIEPYYIPDKQEDAFRHIYRVGGTAAMIGVGIAGGNSGNSYQVTTSKTLVSGIRRQTDELLKQALPLMEIYTDEKNEAFMAFRQELDSSCSDIYQAMSGLPLYTMPRNTLMNILSKNKLTKEQKAEVVNYYDRVLNAVEERLKEYTICDEVPILPENEFIRHPIALQIPGSSLSGRISYTYKEYMEHMSACEEYALSHENYVLKKISDNPFRNINILISRDNFVWISKMMTPTIQFIIRHPGLREAIEHRFITLVDA